MKPPSGRWRAFAVVEAGRTPAVSAGRGIVDLCGCGREQRISPARVEVSTAATGKSTADAHHGLSLPARHQQVEQDGTSAVLVYQFELEREASGELRDSREADQRDKNQDWPQSQSHIRYELLRNRA